MASVNDLLIKSIRSAAVYNSDIQAAPACILWPDKDRQWEVCKNSLKAQIPELFELGDYSPEDKSGPAIWLRSVLANCVEGISVDAVPIIYLPGYSRQDLRAIESCPMALQPLAELQYRGAIWSQLNAKDWTALAFLVSDQGGLGLEVAQDNGTKSSLLLALQQLMDVDISYLQGKHLDKDYFNTLLTGGDPVRDFLSWLNESDDYKNRKDGIAWQGFVEVSKSQLNFDPDKEGLITAAQKLAEGEGPWKSVWQRFCDAPQRYAKIPERIKACSPLLIYLLMRLLLRVGLNGMGIKKLT